MVVRLVLLIILATAYPRVVNGQELVLTASVGRAVFFEDEPIFLVIELTNIGSDTAWVAQFGLPYPSVQVSAHRRDGRPVAVGGIIADQVGGPGNPWRGEPVAPGRSSLWGEPLQFRVGEDRDYRRSLFPRHLAPGEYEIRVTFNAHAGVPQSKPLFLEASPIVFRVRESTAQERREVEELEAIRRVVWDTTTKSQYPPALFSWVERHGGDDPFLPFLLSGWLYGLEPAARKAGRVDLDSLRMAVLATERLSPAGAYLTQTMSAWHPEQLATLANRLGPSLAGKMARYHLERIEYAKQVRNQHAR
jgi:hypothetical protein